MLLRIWCAAVLSTYRRDETNKFWGNNKGSDAHKNQHANEILRRIVRASVWINVHQLPVRCVLT